MSTRRAPRPTPPPQPLLSPSTLTFIGHWRGQLLITLIVLFFGFIYFILRDPIEAFSRRRRERRSAKARGALLALEQDTTTNEETDRGREKGKVVGKRRKGSVLKVDQIGTGGSGSSMEHSPAPRKRGLSSATATVGQQGPASPDIQQKEIEEVYTPKQKGKQKATATPKTGIPSTPGPITPEIRLRRPAEDITPPNTDQIPSDPINSEPVLPPPDREPWAIPLPSSPSAGPSRLSTAPASVSDMSTDGRSDLEYAEDTERTDSRNEEREGDKKDQKGGFSIFPEEGYLPPSALANPSTKKKKRGKSKGTGGGGAAPNTGIQPLLPSSPSTSPLSPTRSTRNGRSGSTSLSQTLTFIPETSTSSPSSATPNRPTHSRSHSRKTSLGGRPANMDLEDLLVERERTIDSLRAEIGLAKAEEARAREEADKAKKGEERMKGEVERVRRAGGKVEQELRRREGELQRQLNQTTQLISAQATRLGMIEQLLSSAGLQLPPPPSPLPSFTGHGQRISSMPASPLPSPLPYPMGYPSPLSRGGMGSPMLAYPSPGMYVSPSPQGGMLHPNSFSHNGPTVSGSGSEHHPLSPSPFRRASASTSIEPDYLAGPLSPGLVPYPGTDIGLGRPSSRSGGYGHSSPGSGSTGSDLARGIEVDGGVGIGGTMDEERRASIATSVLKKKGSVGVLKEVDERVEGLGVGEVGMEGDGENGLIGLGRIGDDAIEGKTNGIERDDQDQEHDNSSSSSSQSPRRILITPGPADSDSIGQNDTNTQTDKHREATNGYTNGHGHDHSATSEPIVFIREESERLGDSRSSSSSGSARIPGLNGTSIKPSNHGEAVYSAYPDPHVDPATRGEMTENGTDIPYTPTFASLAHTPEQLKEIARLREMALKRYNSGTGNGIGENVNGKGKGE